MDRTGPQRFPLKPSLIVMIGVVLIMLLIGGIVSCGRRYVLGEKLVQAARSGDIAGAKKYLHNGARVDFAAEDVGDSAISIAASRGDTAMIELLLKNGADPWEKDMDGKAAFDYAKDESTRKALRGSGPTRERL